MKKLVTDLPKNLTFNTTSYPAVLIDYGKHEIGIIQNSDTEYEEYCKVKQGFLAIIEKIDNSNNSQPIILHVRPVFTVLNKDSLSFFEGEHVTTLYNAMKVVPHITTYQPHSWNASGLNCFHILKPSSKNPSEPNLGLCAFNYEKMSRWMKAIESYYNCVVKETESEEETYTTSVEIKKLRMDSEDAQKKKIAHMEEESQKEEEARLAEKEQNAKDLETLKSSINSIRSKMEASNIKDQKERLLFIEERKKMEEMREFLHREEDCLADKLTDSAMSSELRAENLYTKMSNVAQEAILNKTGETIQEESSKESLVKRMESEDYLKAERDMNDKLKSFLVQETVSFELDLDSSKCSGAEMSKNPKKYFTQVCISLQTPGIMPNLQELKDCVTPDNFCVFCCSKCIGEAHLDDRTVCRNKCENARKGKKECLNVPIQNKVEKITKVFAFIKNDLAKDIYKSYTE